MAESVVILLSTYNGKKYIKEQLDSIFNQVVPALNKLVQDVLQDKMYLFLPAGYVGYYILGYYLCKNRLTDKQKNTILVAGIFGAAYAIIGGILYSQYTGGPSQATYNNLTLNIACYAAAVFIIFKDKVSTIQFTEKEKRRIFASGTGKRTG